jgi:DnaJ-class molecular chaperone
MTSEESDHHVPVTLKELFHGTWNKAYDFPRLVICRGCRDEPDSARCQECGRCPPEKKQVPQFANTPFGRQVVGHKDKMVESLERCGEETLRITGLKIGRGARPGTHMKSMDKVGHQTPGRLPGKVNFKLAYAEDPVYRYVGNHLYTVLSITLAEALYGFEKLIPHVDGKSVFKISRQHATPGEVFKVKSKGMFNPGSGLGDVYIRLKIALPIPDGNNDVTVSQGGADTEAILEAESMLEERAGGVWRRFSEAEEAVDAAKRQVPRTEL